MRVNDTKETYCIEITTKELYDLDKKELRSKCSDGSDLELACNMTAKASRVGENEEGRFVILNHEDYRAIFKSGSCAVQYKKTDDSPLVPPNVLEVRLTKLPAPQPAVTASKSDAW